MRIFASWSGDRSKTAALALRSLLQDLFGEAVQVFISDHINPGEAWAQRLGTELEQSDFGILCLTLENFQAPWLLFEAGAIAKKFGVSRVVPYLIDVLPPASERSPLAQFQHVRADREGTYRLVECINKLRENPRPMERPFAKWWPDLEQTLAALPAPDPDQSVAMSERQLLEQISRHVEGLWQAYRESRELPKSEVIHLQNLRDRPTTTYASNEKLQKELRHLRDSGLIKNKKPIHRLPPNFQLNDHFDLTDEGRNYLQESG
jgi:hypothetical protein